MASVLVTTTMAGAINYTYVTDTSADWASVPNSIYFYDKADKLVHYKNGSGSILEIFSSAGGLTYFTEDQNTSAPNATVYVDSLTAVSSTTSADISIIPKGSGSFLLDIPNGLASGGNKRGLYAVDLQMDRSSATEVGSGNYSFTVGYSNTSSNTSTIAMGQSNNVSGFSSVALGYENTVTGQYSFATGILNTVGGSYAVVAGNQNSASDYSVSIGNLNSIGTSTLNASIGHNNIHNGAVHGYSFGRGNTVGASATNSFVAGYNNLVSADRAVAIGGGVTASAQSSSALGGQNNTASGQYSFCGGGLQNTASGLYSVAFGNLCSSVGAASLTFGQSNTANGVFSVCLGSQNTTGNNASFAIGTSNFASGGNYSGAMGYLCQATSESAFAIGQSNYSYARSSFTLGENNTSDGSYSITVGFNGSSLSLKNKFTLGGGAFGVRGDSQIGILPLRSRTTDATPSILTTDFSAPSTTNQLILQNNQLITFSGQIQGKKIGTTEVGVWSISGVIVRGASASTTTLTIGNVNLVTNASAWGVPTLTADTVNGGLKVTVIGLSATNIQWGCRIDTVETIY